MILSDIGHDTLVTYPGERRYQVPMGPNRLKEIARDYAFMMWQVGLAEGARP